MSISSALSLLTALQEHPFAHQCFGSVLCHQIIDSGTFASSNRSFEAQTLQKAISHLCCHYLLLKLHIAVIFSLFSAFNYSINVLQELEHPLNIFSFLGISFFFELVFNLSSSEHYVLLRFRLRRCRIHLLCCRDT